MAKNNNGKAESFEKTLFKAADKLRKNIDAAEYPPDLELLATENVLKQAELLADEWGSGTV